jgi:hypothetical protein
MRPIHDEAMELPVDRGVAFAARVPERRRLSSVAESYTGWFELANNTQRREALQEKRQYQPLEKGLQ